MITLFEILSVDVMFNVFVWFTMQHNVPVHEMTRVRPVDRT